MRRILILLAPMALASASYCQVWEKLVAPGLTYRMEIEAVPPRIIHALRWCINSTAVEALPELASKTVFSQNEGDGRATVSDLVRQADAVAGINADFFPWSGDPIGLMVRDGELISRPYPNRSFLGWGKGGAFVRTSGFRAKFVLRDMAIPIDGWNEECGENMVCVNTATAGMARTKSSAVHVILAVSEVERKDSEPIRAVIKEIVPSSGSIRVQPGTIVLTASGDASLALAALPIGAEADLEFALDGFDFESSSQAIAGGPILLRDGKWSNRWQLEGFKEGFALHRHPRTAVGRTDNGFLWFVAIDGRSNLSVGATLEEAAKIMARLGCKDALNLDGGGSTTMNLFGITVNRPSDGKERPVANGIVFRAKPANLSEGAYSLEGPEAVSPTEVRGFRVKNGSGMVAISEVIWSASGEGWMDQGGYFRPIKEGSATITAYCRGQVLKRKVEISSALSRR